MSTPIPLAASTSTPLHQAAVTDAALPGPLEWKVGSHPASHEKPKEWHPASVPGAVQLDYAAAHGWGDYNFGDRWKDYLWMEDVFWTYRTTFRKPSLTDGEQCYFVSRGIDYRFEIHLNGMRLLEQEGMFTPVELNLTERLLEENVLEVLLHPVPKIPGTPESRYRSNAAQSAKPAVSYGWDWHLRLIPSGIWDETYLERRNRSHLGDVWVDYELSSDLQVATLRLVVEGENLEQSEYDWQLTGPEGQIALARSGRMSDLNNGRIELLRPELWWTHDHGRPNLYTSEFILKEAGRILDRKVQQIGFRRIQLVMHDGAWQWPDTFPKGRSNPPITVELNGRKIFGKGSNWVNPEIFPGIITRERYAGLIDHAVSANFNLLRVWGGGIVNKESFYELCDEKGVMVWTEFPLACNNYLATPPYLAVLRQESESILRRIRRHACNVIWCGGNELFNSWSGMTDQSLALRLLNSQCLRLDPKTPFLPTSPIMGMAHGNYVFRYADSGKEVFQVMPESVATAYTEFGMPGASSVELLRRIIPTEELFPPRPGTCWESHHAFKAWQGDTWLMKDLLESYFGKAEDLETLVEQSQWLQCEGYKCIFEEARRQKPVCAMALNWCYNEPWITAANNSLINYPNQPKPAFHAVARACRPFLASARIPKFSWREGETFAAQIFILNDLYEDIPAGGLVTAKLRAGGREVELLQWRFGTAGANRNIEGPTARGIVPEWNTDRFELVLEVEGRDEHSSTYLLQCRK